MRIKRVFLVATVGLAGLLYLAGCGSDNDGSSAAPISIEGMWSIYEEDVYERPSFPPFNAALTSLDISENFLFGSKPLHDQVPDGPRKQLPDQEQGGWRRLCAALPETCVSELVVQEIGLGRQGADILAATMAAAAANAEQPGGKPLRLRNVDLRRNETLSVGYLAQFEDPEKNLLVRH